MIQSVWKNLTGLIPAEHLWCDFKWATNSSPNTNDLYIHYMDKSTDTPSLEEKKALPNRANKDENITHVLKNCISISVVTLNADLETKTHHLTLKCGASYVMQTSKSQIIHYA